MKNFSAILFVLFIFHAWGQQSKDQQKVIQIIEEGKLLYRSEVASWLGTDLFLENYTDRANIGGYFSYADGALTRCVFYNREPLPKIIGTVEFNGQFDKNTASLDLSTRTLTDLEYSLYLIRKAALENLQTNSGDFYSFYSNSNPNIIPLIQGKEKKVYILTGPTVDGVVIFGNDYLLTIDKKGKVKSRQALHQNIIPMEFSNADEQEDAKISMHSHNAKTGDFITATDVCTLLLYARAANWRMHYVISPKYLNIWDCETESLQLLPRDSFKKIIEDQEKRNSSNE